MTRRSQCVSTLGIVKIDLVRRTGVSEDATPEGQVSLIESARSVTWWTDDERARVRHASRHVQAEPVLPQGLVYMAMIMILSCNHRYCDSARRISRIRRPMIRNLLKTAGYITDSTSSVSPTKLHRRVRGISSEFKSRSTHPPMSGPHNFSDRR